MHDNSAKLDRSTWLIVLSTVLGFVLALSAAGCGGQSDAERTATEARIERERAEAAKQARLEEKVKQLESDLKESKKRPKSSSSSGSSRSAKPTSRSSGAGSWPSGTSAWTVILTSADSRGEAESTAAAARSSGLGEVGVLYSSDFSSLRPGYWVAYTGVLDKSGAKVRQSEAQSAGFSDAYARFVGGD